MNKYLGPILGLTLLSIVACRDAQATVSTYFVTLYGSIDATGSTSILGHGTVSIDSDAYQLSWSFDVPGISDLKEASIRSGPPGLSGPQVVRLRNEMHGSGLRDTDLSTIVLHPNDYYVLLRPRITTTNPNVRAYRGLRGQLAESTAVPEPTTLTLLGVAMVGGTLAKARRRKRA